MKKQLFIIRGLPGSGKSTFANLIGGDTRIIEADDYFYDHFGNYNFDINKLGEAHDYCKKNVESWMLLSKLDNSDYKIIVSNTSTTEKELKPYLDLAEKYEYTVTSIILENRHGSKSIHNVPDETMDKMRKRFSVKL